MKVWTAEERREFKRKVRASKWETILSTNPLDLATAYIVAFLFTGHGPFYVKPFTEDEKAETTK